MKISFKRLLEIHENLDNIELINGEEILKANNAVYIIFNDKLNIAYIGETVNVFYRIFRFWKEDKRHVDGVNAPISKYFNRDYENTFIEILEHDCENIKREYYWHDYYRNNSNYIIVSHPGRHGCTEPGNKGMIAIHRGDKQTYIRKDDLKLFESLGWEKGGKRNHPRTLEQRERISKSHLGQIPWNKGLETTDEVRKKQSEAHRRKGLYRKPNGELIDFPKASVKRHHPDWVFIRDIY